MRKDLDILFGFEPACSTAYPRKYLGAQGVFHYQTPMFFLMGMSAFELFWFLAFLTLSDWCSELVLSW